MTHEEFVRRIRQEANVIADLIDRYDVQHPLRLKLIYVEARLNAACNARELEETCEVQVEAVKATDESPV